MGFGPVSLGPFSLSRLNLGRTRLGGVYSRSPSLPVSHLFLRGRGPYMAAVPTVASLSLEKELLRFQPGAAAYGGGIPRESISPYASVLNPPHSAATRTACAKSASVKNEPSLLIPLIRLGLDADESSSDPLVFVTDSAHCIMMSLVMPSRSIGIGLGFDRDFFDFSDLLAIDSSSPSLVAPSLFLRRRLGELVLMGSVNPLLPVNPL